MGEEWFARLLDCQSAHEKPRSKPGHEGDEALDDNADEKGRLIQQERQRARMLQPLQMFLHDEACDGNRGEGPQGYPGAPSDKRGTCERQEREDEGYLWEVGEIPMQALPRRSGDRVRDLVSDQDSECCQRHHEQPWSKGTLHAEIMPGMCTSGLHAAPAFEKALSR